MAADGGGMFFGWSTADQFPKKDCGLKMAADGGSVFFGGIPLPMREKIAGAMRQRMRLQG